MSEHSPFNTKIQAKFFRAFKGGRNFVTPDICGYGQAGRYIWELSSGFGLTPQTRVYGVTVLSEDGQLTGLSKGGFTSKESAEAYIKDLLGEEE